jgi:hypothetical protein
MFQYTGQVDLMIFKCNFTFLDAKATTTSEIFLKSILNLQISFNSLMDCQQKCRNIALEPKCPQGRAHRDSNGNFYKCSTKAGGKT